MNEKQAINRKPLTVPDSLRLLLLILLGGLGLAGLASPSMAAPSALPQQARLSHAAAANPVLPAPDFTLTDTEGKTRRLSQYRGRPVILAFVCGCPWCQNFARVWGQFQRGGVLASSEAAPSADPALSPITLVIYSRDAPAARAFSAETGLDPAQTVLLTDPQLRVTQTLYHADPCPRVFVLDAQGHLRYTNNHKGDAARDAPALTIASRALDALRAEPAPAKSIPALAPQPLLTLPVTDFPVTNLPVTTLDGKPLDLAAQSGWKVLYFWSATCPCVRACESFTFIPLSQHYRSQISFYAIASNGYDLHLPRVQLVHQIHQRKLPFPVLLDDRHLVALALNAKVTPQAFLLDPQNRVVFAGIPDDSRRYENRTGHWGVSQSYLSQAITQALEGQPITVPTVKDQGCIIAW